MIDYVRNVTVKEIRYLARKRGGGFYKIVGSVMGLGGEGIGTSDEK